MQNLNFTAIDFETANGKRGSVCAVGLTKVKAGSAVDSQSWLIRPPAGLEHFEPRNIAIHGIRPSDVVGAPDWGRSLQRIIDFAAGDPFVAHNAAFDRSVFKAACLSSRLDLPPVEFFCSLQLARRELALDAYTLPDVAKAMGLAGFKHHHAGSDADVCASSVIEIARQKRLLTLEHLWPARTHADGKSFSRGVTLSDRKSPTLAELPQPSSAADPHGPLFGQVAVFSGELATMSRDEAMIELAGRGASNGKGITKKTTILIIGTNNAHQPSVQLRGDGGAKERKALAYIGAGQSIQVLSERQLLEMMGRTDSAEGTAAPQLPEAGPARPAPAGWRTVARWARSLVKSTQP